LPKYFNDAQRYLWTAQYLFFKGKYRYHNLFLTVIHIAYTLKIDLAVYYCKKLPMKFLTCTIVFIFAVCNVYTQQSIVLTIKNTSPLAGFSAAWNNPEYEQCNTAAEEKFMSAKEKEVIYILNLVRSNPQLFAGTVLAKYPALAGKDYLLDNKYYYQSLITTLRKMEQQTLLYADKECYASAACHAQKSGSTGYTGHVRNGADCKTKKHYLGECCDYGNENPLEIILSLLIDEGVPSLGHRSILLGDFESIGVAIRSHKTYGHNAVLDFY
jgi:uncharacterized protein YkwD